MCPIDTLNECNQKMQSLLRIYQSISRRSFHFTNCPCVFTAAATTNSGAQIHLGIASLPGARFAHHPIRDERRVGGHCYNSTVQLLRQWPPSAAVPDGWRVGWQQFNGNGRRRLLRIPSTRHHVPHQQQYGSLSHLVPDHKSAGRLQLRGPCSGEKRPRME